MKKIVISILCTIVSIHLCLAQLTTEPLVFGEQFELFSKFNDTNYKISVRLPEGYSKDSVDHPCLYLFYGHDTKFFVASGIAASLFEATWQTPKMIIVGVTNMDWWRDLTPVPIAGSEGTGGADKFHSFVVQDLFKTIDTNYRTTDQRIFMGHSFCGLFGIYSFINNSDDFDEFLLISPSIAERADYISDAFKQKILSSENLRNKLYISFGSNEPSRILKSVLWLQEGLQTKEHKNLKWRFEMHEGHNHHTHAQISILNGLLFIFENDTN